MEYALLILFYIVVRGFDYLRERTTFKYNKEIRSIDAEVQKQNMREGTIQMKEQTSQQFLSQQRDEGDAFA